MESEQLWELVEPPKTHRKILRNSIIAHMSPAYPGCFEHSNSTLQSKIINNIPTQGITCDELHKILNLEHSAIYAYLTTLIKNRVVVSIKINGKPTRYYKEEDDNSTKKK